MGRPLADLHSTDYPPRVLAPLPVLAGYESEAIDSMDLSLYMKDLDDPEGMSYQITVMSDESVAYLSITADTLSGFFGMAGQSNLVIEGTSGGYSVSASTLVATWPKMEGDYQLSDFEDLSLDPESYWNGSDGSGSFSTGAGPFSQRLRYGILFLEWLGLFKHFGCDHPGLFEPVQCHYRCRFFRWGE